MKRKQKGGNELGRKKKIPSVDYAMRLVMERLRSDLGRQIADLQRTLESMEARVGSLESVMETWDEEGEKPILVRADYMPKGTRRRVPPEEAKRAILNQLKKAAGEFIPARELGAPLGIGRATAATRIKELQKEGVNIVSSPRKGYALLD
jgi:biotin operon repressor